MTLLMNVLRFRKAARALPSHDSAHKLRISSGSRKPADQRCEAGFRQPQNLQTGDIAEKKDLHKIGICQLLFRAPRSKPVQQQSPKWMESQDHHEPGYSSLMTKRIWSLQHGVNWS